MKPIRILDWFTIKEARGGYYGDSVYVRVNQSGKTFWLRAADAEDGFVNVAAQAAIKNLMECYLPTRRADARIRKLLRIAEKWFAGERAKEKQVWLEDIYSELTAKKGIRAIEGRRCC